MGAQDVSRPAPSLAQEQALAQRRQPTRAGHRASPRTRTLSYKYAKAEVYNNGMDIAVSELRAHLSEYLDRVRAGDEVVITDRGIPVARLLGLTTTATLERLAADGVIGRAAAPARPRASGQQRPRPLRPVAELVGDQRR